MTLSANEGTLLLSQQRSFVQPIPTVITLECQICFKSLPSPVQAASLSTQGSFCLLLLMSSEFQLRKVCCETLLIIESSHSFDLSREYPIILAYLEIIIRI